jgi:uncharacterized protein VirK/YbjX
VANFVITWREKKQLLVGSVQASAAGEALEMFRATKPAGSFPVSGVLQTDGKISKVIKSDGSCYAVLVEA